MSYYDYKDGLYEDYNSSAGSPSYTYSPTYSSASAYSGEPMSQYTSSSGFSTSSATDHLDSYLTSEQSLQSMTPEQYKAQWGLDMARYELVHPSNGAAYWLLKDGYQATAGQPKTVKYSDTGKGNAIACLWENCDSTASPKRVHDAQRHYEAVHAMERSRFDCPKSNCQRKGSDGFGRKDHLREHLRDYHLEKIEKRRR